MSYPHPGRVLEDFIADHNQTAAELAKAIHVQKDRVYKILAGERGITVDTALRLAKHYGTTPELWLAAQIKYEIDCCKADNSEIYQRIQPLEQQS